MLTYIQARQFRNRYSFFQVLCYRYIDKRDQFSWLIDLEIVHFCDKNKHLGHLGGLGAF